MSDAHAPDRLVLWDIDGTLIRAGMLARDVFDTAVGRVLGRHPGEHAVQMSGKTDPQIAMEILAFAAVADEAPDHVTAVLGHLESALAVGEAALREHGRVLPGVREVLAELDADADVHQSVLTGNTLANATVKLRAFDLDGWLDLEVGAFGSDDADRNRLVPVALERMARLRGRKVAPGRVWVVGDTPHDLACARAGGVRCLLVGTGRFPLADLRAAEPDAVLPDLSDVAAVTGLLRS